MISLIRLLLLHYKIILTLSYRSSSILHYSDSNLMEAFRTVILVTLIYDRSYKCIQKVRLMILLMCLLLLHYKLYLHYRIDRLRF